MPAQFTKLNLFGAIVLLAVVPDGSAEAQSFRIERIASGLNQPTYVTQAPGDPANILYFTERTSNTIGGFGAFNQMGKVWRYDVDTRAQQLVLDLSNRFVTQDTGLHNVAFHPDFNNEGTTGYRKMYVTLSEPGTTPVNKVEEYSIEPNGVAAFNRMILQYNNSSSVFNNHTINWAGFDPTATGDERDHLYISTGDGSFGHNYDSGNSHNGRPSQNPADVQGKILRIDVDPTHADAYPSDPLKNFAIPASNPIPTYNAAHPGAPLMGIGKVRGRGAIYVPEPALGEVYVTGVRNGYRMSFDRVTGDLWLGDVGENFVEEINVLKAGSNTTGPPVDFGWPQWEGLEETLINGAPHTETNPFTGVTSLNPIQQHFHSQGDFAWIGGYVYRGPVTELFGKYFFSEFVVGRTYMLDFDRDTDPNNYNANNGTLLNVSALWESLVVDPTDPTYLPNQSMFGLDHVVSFGEDNAGNLYLVDFGDGGQYPNAGRGEIFRVTPIVPEPASWLLAAGLTLGMMAARRRAA
jgi:glucose/arabinose dehydrogenase